MNVKIEARLIEYGLGHFVSFYFNVLMIPLRMSNANCYIGVCMERQIFPKLWSAEYLLVTQNKSKTQ